MLSRDLRKRALASSDGSTPKRSRPPRRLANRATGAAERQATSAALRVRESALFRPVRAIGAVSDGIPFAPASLGTADFLTVGVGRGFQVFDCSNLRLVYLSPRLNDRVQALLCVGQVTLTSLKEDIVAWHKLTELGRFKGHTGTPTVMCPVGTGYLVSGAGAEVLVWQLSDIGLEANSVTPGKSCVLAPLGKLATEDTVGDCTAICHPPTYLHKVIVGGSSGGLSLWNVRTRECVHTFKSHKAGDTKGDCAITCLREAPHVLDLVAIGFASGRLAVVNTREDRCLFEFNQDQGRITSLAFRTGRDAPAHLVSGAPNGAFVIWDLDKRRAHHVVDEAHHGPVTSLHFLPGQPLLLTGGRDNTVREWIFDTADGLPRLLRFRCGCPGPARRMFFYRKSDDRQLIVGGGSEGAGFVARVSCTQLHQNATFSQNNLKKIPSSVKFGQLVHSKRLPPIVDLDFCEPRHFDWPAVVTAHEGMDSAFVWSAQHMALAPAILRPPATSDQAPVSAVAISKCGNYVVIGLENGALHRFNLQSQLHRGTIPKAEERESGAGDANGSNAKGARVEPPPRAHLGRICGIEITSSGLVVSAASHPNDCALGIWKLMTHAALERIPLSSRGRGGDRAGSSPLVMRAHGALVAVSLDDGLLLVVDLHGRSVVRSFPCGLPAIDIAFSAEARWLAVALRGGGLRIFDLPAARCVDSFAFARPALSICFSPSTAYLLTSHAKGNAIQMWANKFLFDPSLSAPLLQPELKAPIMVDEPGDPGDQAESDEDVEVDERKKAPAGEADEADAVNVVPLGKELLTLSDVPPAKWLAILHLDVVKERNKPTALPKPLPNAPFFLPTAHEGVTSRFAIDEPKHAGAEDADQQPQKQERPSLEEATLEGLVAPSERGSRIFKAANSPVTGGTSFQALLRGGDFDGALAFLKKQMPSGVHIAIEELGPLSGGDLGELTACLEFFLHHHQKAHYADELQAYLSLFLQAHGEELAQAEELRRLCAKLCSAQEARWTELDERCHKVRCFLGMLTHTQSQW
mmetsp:Transcript_65631/g.182564  ORF Transcript_65631/g.182564 Transcript_65631/m.182564 type:complete len:1032 (-) Transcript_65631:123-3218(-)